MKKYCCGFIFDLSGNRILLILKKRPAWQAGYFNGIGGSVEENETPLMAMQRECLEECNLSITTWTNYSELKGEGWSVEFFFTFTNKISNFKSLTEEIAEIFNVKNLPKNVLPNIPWLIAMAQNFDLDRADKLIITEINEENRSETENSVNKPVTKYIKAEQFELPLNN